MFAGLCVWTRNQGVFVAIVAALLLAERVPGVPASASSASPGSGSCRSRRMAG
ncbi:hypothetical protein ACN28S_21740 [Cystobacter fuscus]